MHFDRSKLVELVGDDEEVLREISALFLTDTRDLLAQMQDAARSEDVAVLRRLGHTLKSSAASMGCEPASALAAALESTGDPALIPRLATELAAAFREIELVAFPGPAVGR